MSDDQGRGDEQEPKITVRDRRRVSAEGTLREVPAGPEPTSPEPPVEQLPPPPPAEPEPPRQAAGGGRPRRSSAASGGGLGGADEARVRRGPGPRLREVSDAEDDKPAADEAPEGGAPGVKNVYEYIAAVTAEMTIWCLSALGLVPNPLTRIVATDLEQAKFSQLTAERLLDTLDGSLPAEELGGLTQNFVMQFAGVAAQLLQQPPQVRLAEIQKIRFCIDAADVFLKRLADIELPPGVLQVGELSRLVAELKLRFLQASGGGGIVG